MMDRYIDVLSFVPLALMILIAIWILRILPDYIKLDNRGD